MPWRITIKDRKTSCETHHYIDTKVDLAISLLTFGFSDNYGYGYLMETPFSETRSIQCHRFIWKTNVVERYLVTVHAFMDSENMTLKI